MLAEALDEQAIGPTDRRTDRPEDRQTKTGREQTDRQTDR